MQVELAYVNNAEQKIMSFSVRPKTTVLKLLQDIQLPASLLAKNDLETRIGIFGKKVNFARVLKDGDRVEIYQDLLCDPKEARRLRAKTQRSSSIKR